MEKETGFRNVDLDIESAEDLRPLADALSTSTLPLQCEQLDDGTWRLCLELIEHPADAEQAVTRFLEALALLPEDARRIWRQAGKRSFNVGIEAGSGPWWRATFTAAMLRAVADHDAVIEITVYGPARPT